MTFSQGEGDLYAIAKGNTDETPAGHLNVTVTADYDGNSGSSNLTLKTKSADIVVDNSAVWLDGDLPEAQVSLVITPDEDGEIEQILDTYFFVGLSNNKNLESLVISGTGRAEIERDVNTKLSYIDVSGMDFAEDSWGSYSGLEYSSEAEKAVTIILGDGVDEISLRASIYQDGSGDHAFDSVHNFNFVNKGNDTFARDSDVLSIPALRGLDSSDFVVFDATAYSSLDLALKAAAEENPDAAAIFEFAGNTYVFVDTAIGAVGQINADDTVVEIVGSYDLDALAFALWAEENPGL